MSRRTIPVLLTFPAIAALTLAVATILLSVSGVVWWAWLSTASASCIFSLMVGGDEVDEVDL
jgi:hypothetical protein